MDYNERVYCRQRHLSEKALRKSWSSSHQETLIKQIVEVLQISGVGPLGLSQQFNTLRDSSSKIIYVKGAWLCSFVFKVTSSRFELKEDFSSHDIRVCPKSLLENLRSAVLTIIFQPQAPKNTTTLFLLHSEALRHTKVTLPVGGWVISPWIKWIASRDFSSLMVQCRGTSSLPPCGKNSYLTWTKFGWPCIPASYSRTRSIFHSPTSL